MEQPVVRVGVAVIVRNQDGHVLFGERCDKHRPGTWGLPGGHLEMGEQPEESAIRELREETGMVATAVRMYAHCPYANTIFPAEHGNSFRQYITLFFEAVTVTGEPQLLEPTKCRRWLWFPIDAPPEPLFEAVTYRALRLDEK